MAAKTLFDQLPIAIPSMCLGRAAHHELEPKLQAAAKAGFKGIEVFYEDIKIPAKKYMASTSSTFEQSLLHSAQEFRSLCDKFNLTIMCLQPFKNYEGLKSRKRHEEKIAKLHVWFTIVKILRTDIIQIPSCFWAEKTTGDIDKIVEDIREVADLGAKEDPPIRFAYEPMAWGAHIDTWQQGWEIVQCVNRDNFGMCLDTYQILAKVWADVTSPTGTLPNADQRLEEDIKEFLTTVTKDKIYYIQLSDAERIDPPLRPGHAWWVEKQKPNMTWSRNARTFPLEKERGGYLPVVRLFEAWIFDWGYRGWVSLEIFNRSMGESGEDVPESHAMRGMESWRKLVQMFELDRRTK
jgi:4-hydroxyphenylpyruvate dioxygenase